MGERVYLLNKSLCQVSVMDQHNGSLVPSGETTLVKPGFLDRTPTMLIAVNGDILFGGLHFASGKLEIRGRSDIIIPKEWLETSFLDSSLTYELTAKGELILHSHQGNGSHAIAQPLGLPLVGRFGRRSIECMRG